MTNPLCTWDFTLKAEGLELDNVIKGIKSFSKKYCFQLEKGAESGYLHYQGRISLKVKARLPQVVNHFSNNEMPGVHLSPTSDANKDNYFYVMKEDTRQAGPWKDTDIEIPEDLKDIEELRPWQVQVLESADVLDTRHINVIANLKGNMGKSTLVKWGCVHGEGKIRKVPGTIQKAEDLMQWVCSFEPAKLYFFDLPRAMNQQKLNELYAAVEEIKGGYAYDKRYHGVERWFTCPQIWIFCNHMPKSEYLSADRWVFWEVDDEKKLIKK